MYVSMWCTDIYNVLNLSCTVISVLDVVLDSYVVVSYVFPKCIIKSTTQNTLLLNLKFVHPHWKKVRHTPAWYSLF